MKLVAGFASICICPGNNVINHHKPSFVVQFLLVERNSQQVSLGFGIMQKPFVKFKLKDFVFQRIGFGLVAWFLCCLLYTSRCV